MPVQRFKIISGWLRIIFKFSRRRETRSSSAWCKEIPISKVETAHSPFSNFALTSMNWGEARETDEDALVSPATRVFWATCPSRAGPISAGLRLSKMWKWPSRAFQSSGCCSGSLFRSSTSRSVGHAISWFLQRGHLCRTGCSEEIICLKQSRWRRCPFLQQGKQSEISTVR